MDESNINKHFRRETKIMIGVMVFPIVLGLLLMVIWPYIFSTSKIYICLDNGGSFNYENCSCDFKTTHKAIKKYQCK